LSIVQDLDDTGIKRFAQPIVFHLLDQPLSLLIHSESFASSLKYFRLRIPARPVVGPITRVYAANQVDDPDHGKIVPAIEVLDLSTCMVRENDIDSLLSRFSTLQHLILDDCVGLLRHAAGPAFGEEYVWWNSLGRRCAMFGLKKARDKEKELKALLDTLRQQQQRQQANNDISANIDQRREPRKSRQGRRGLATARITIRGANALSEAGSSTQLPLGLSIAPNIAPPKVNVLPPTPILKSLSLHAELKGIQLTGPQPDRSKIINEFEQGWYDGLRAVWDRRHRMGKSFKREREAHVNSVYCAFRPARDRDEEGDAFQDLVLIFKEDEHLFSAPRDAETADVMFPDAPILCLAGASLDPHAHSITCGHSMASAVWTERCE
jgi:hypothetical protein